MSLRFRRALAVCLDDRSADAALGALAALGVAGIGRAAAPDRALALIGETEPDLVVADAVLPGADGVALARRIRGLRLNVQPGVLLLRPRGLRLPGEDALDSLGAAIIEAPPDRASLIAALSGPDALLPPLPPEKAVRLHALLDALGVPDHPGRDCLARAVTLVWADRRRLRSLKDELYPALHRQTGLDPARAERAMRHAIDAAWRTGALEAQHRIFGDTIDARRGKPTCGEMIAQLAEELRWEGQT